MSEFKICTVKGIDLYEKDIVKVQGRKRVGIYETEIVRCFQGWTLKSNKGIVLTKKQGTDLL